MSDESVMFEVGVFDSPKTTSKLEALAKSIESYQERMTAGVGSIGTAVASTKSLVEAATPAIRQLRDEGVQAATQMRTSFSQAIAEIATASVPSRAPALAIPTSKPVSPSSTGSETLPSGGQEHSASIADRETGKNADVRGMAGEVDRLEKSIENLRATIKDTPQDFAKLVASLREVTDAMNAAAESARDVGAGRKPSLDIPSIDGVATIEHAAEEVKSVLDEMASVAETQVDRVVEAFDGEMGSLPESAQSVTDALRSEYEQQMVALSEAYAEMASDIDSYVAKEGSAVDKIAANMRRAEASVDGFRKDYSDATDEVDQGAIKMFRSSIQVVRGFAEVGLVSEENMMHFMQSMAVIQGVFNIFEGGVEALDAYRKAKRAVIAATESSMALQRAERVLQMEQFASMKAYQAQLAQETVAANAAAAANARLAASRGASLPTARLIGAGGANSVASLAAGVASEAAISRAVAKGVVTAGTGAAATTSASGIGTVVGGIAAAGLSVKLGLLAAAVAATTGAFVGAKEMLTGQLSNPKSWFGWGAEKTLGAAAYAREKTVGDVEGFTPIGQVVSSNRVTRRAEMRQQRSRVQANVAADKEWAEFQAAQANSQANWSKESQLAALLGGNRESLGVGQLQLEIDASKASSEIAELQRTIDSFRNGEIFDSGMAETATKDLNSVYQTAEAGIAAHSATSRAFFEKTFADWQSVEQTQRTQIVELEKKHAELADGGLEKDEKRKEIAAQIETLYDNLNGTLEQQRTVQNQMAEEQIVSERKLAEMTRTRLEDNIARAQQLLNIGRNSARSYVDMSAIDRMVADSAVEKARAGGAEKLNERERSVLSRVGTEETDRYVQQSYSARANELGYEDRYGRPTKDELETLGKERTTLEASLQANYEVMLDVKMDTVALVSSIVEKITSAMKDKWTEIEQETMKKLEIQKAEVVQIGAMEMRQIKTVR